MKSKKSERIKAVRLMVDQETHRLLRRVAANDDQSMSDWVHDLVSSAVRKEADRLDMK